MAADAAQPRVPVEDEATLPAADAEAGDAAAGLDGDDSDDNDEPTAARAEGHNLPAVLSLSAAPDGCVCRWH